MKGAHVTYGDKSYPTQAILGTRVLAHSVLIFLHILPQNNPVCHLRSFTLCLLMTPNELFCPSLFSGSGQVHGTPPRVPRLSANLLQPCRFLFLGFLSTAIKFLQLNQPSSI